MFGALTIANPFSMMLLLLAGFWTFACGLTVGLIGNSCHAGGTSNRRLLLLVRMALISTTIILIVTTSLFHLHRTNILEIWIEWRLSDKKLVYQSVSQAFNIKGIWVVTVTSVTGALASLFTFVSTFVGRRSSTFSLHKNLSSVESSGWVYESSPGPDILENCPATKLIQSCVKLSQQKYRKQNLKTTSVTLLSFKMEQNVSRSLSYPLQRTKEKLILVDSSPFIHCSPLNLNFENTGLGVNKHNTLEENSSTESQSSCSSQHIALDKLQGDKNILVGNYN